MSKRLVGGGNNIDNIGCKDKRSSWYLMGFPDGSSVANRVNSIVSGRNPPLYSTLNLLISMQVHPRGKDTQGNHLLLSSNGFMIGLLEFFRKYYNNTVVA